MKLFKFQRVFKFSTHLKINLIFLKNNIGLQMIILIFDLNQLVFFLLYI